MNVRIKCKDCGKEFKFTDEERNFFVSKGLETPKRCKECRIKRRKDRWKREELPKQAE